MARLEAGCAWWGLSKSRLEGLSSLTSLMGSAPLSPLGHCLVGMGWEELLWHFWVVPCSRAPDAGVSALDQGSKWLKLIHIPGVLLCTQSWVLETQTCYDPCLLKILVSLSILCVDPG